MNHVIYCRISRDRTGKEAGVQRQENECRAYAEQHGLTVTHVYVDNDISAYSGKERPEYAAMLDAVRAGKIGGIIAWHYDRLIRRLGDLETLLTAVEESNTEVRTVKAGDIDLSTPTGRMNARLVASIASYEIEHAQERLRSSQIDRAARGLWRSGKPPFAYRAADAPGHLEAAPGEWAAARTAADKLLAGRTATSVARWLNDEGWRTRHGKKWTAGTIRTYFTSGVVAGESIHHGKVVGTGQWPALLSADEAATIRAVLTDPARLTHQGQERRWMLTGIMRCGACGGGLRCQRSRNVCGWSYTCKECGGVSCDQKRTDDFFTDVVLGYLERPDNQLVVSSGDDENVADLLVELDQLNDRRAALGRLFAAGEIDEVALTSGTTVLRSKIDALNERIESARRVSAAADLILAGDVLRERWADMSADQKASVVREIMTITVEPAERPGQRWSPERFTIEWKATREDTK